MTVEEFILPAKNDADIMRASVIGRQRMKGACAMKANEGMKAYNEETEILNKKLAELADDALRQVTGGRGEPGALERILSELAAWLEAHPNATKSDICEILRKMKEENADILTADELSALNELLNSFAS